LQQNSDFLLIGENLKSIEWRHYTSSPWVTQACIRWTNILFWGHKWKEFIVKRHNILWSQCKATTCKSSLQHLKTKQAFFYWPYIIKLRNKNKKSN
jgi:hypothetical protein